MQQHEPRLVGGTVILAGLLGFALPEATPAVQYPDQAARAGASEVLKLTVRQVNTGKAAAPGEPQLVEIVAQVVEVRKSRSNLQGGDVIIIRYFWNPNGESQARKDNEADAGKGMTGGERLYAPHPPAAGDLMMAYLSQHYDEETQVSKVYYPCAGQYSFLVLKSKAAK